MEKVVETVDKKILWGVIGLLVLVVIWLGFGSGPLAVHEGNDPGADHVIGGESSGSMVGHSPIKAQEGLGGVKNISRANPIADGENVAGGGWLWLQSEGLEIGQSGIIKTRYFDRRSGLLIGEGQHDFSGSTKIWLESGEVWAKTTFTNSWDLSIDLPRQKWAAGVLGGVGFDGPLWGVFYERQGWLGCRVRAEAVKGDGWEGRAYIEIPIMQK